MSTKNGNNISTHLTNNGRNKNNIHQGLNDDATEEAVPTEISSLMEEISMLQLGDSFFPTGMYTTSSGLETLFYDKRIKTREEIKEFITISLKYQIGPADCVALANAFEFVKEENISKIIEVDQTLYSMKLVKDIRDASIRSGRQLLNCLLSFVQDKTIVSSYYNSIKNKSASGIFPVALAVASNVLKIKKESACIILLYGYTVSIVGAALRLGILQHFEAQQIIHDLKPVMTNVIHNNINKDLSNLWQFSPGIDLVQMKHERMDSKMFIT